MYVCVCFCTIHRKVIRLLTKLLVDAANSFHLLPAQASCEPHQPEYGRAWALWNVKLAYVFICRIDTWTCWVRRPSNRCSLETSYGLAGCACLYTYCSLCVFMCTRVPPCMCVGMYVCLFVCTHVRVSI